VYVWCRLEEELKAAHALTDEERNRRQEVEELLAAEKRKNDELKQRIKAYVPLHTHT
jgi:hypothetical protein